MRKKPTIRMKSNETAVEVFELFLLTKRADGVKPRTIALIQDIRLAPNPLKGYLIANTSFVKINKIIYNCLCNIVNSIIDFEVKIRIIISR